MAYRAILFDFDYTLADATKGIVLSYNYALERAGFPAAAENTVRNTVGMTVEDALHTMCGNSCGEELILKMKEYFVQKANEVMLPNTSLFPHTRPLLQELKKRGIKTGIVSTKYRYRIEDVFRRENLLDTIGTIVGVEDTPKPKPNPESLLKAINTLSCGRQDVLYTGDHLIDAQTALAAGVNFAAVLTGTTTRQAFSPYPCKYILKNAGELINTLYL